MRYSSVILLAGAVALLGWAEPCQAATRYYTNRHPWHGNYYDVAVGQPLAVVVPPTARRQIDYSWGVTGTESTRITHKFRRSYPGMNGVGRYGFQPTPPWPGHTNQFGDYYVKGPW